MTVHLAVRTLAAINATLVADNGASFRGWLGRVMPHISDAYDTEDDPYRSHLGASVIGGECERAIAFAYRWAYKRPPRGKKGEDKKVAHARMVRLWNRGHMEEGRFVALLLATGILVYQQENGKQYRIVDLGGHFSGSMDGILVGVPDLPPGVPCLGEFKTHSDKSFKALVESGVQKSKHTHYVQMQMYMAGKGLLYALYMAVNKDTDELYAEIVLFDGDVSKRHLERAKRIVYDHKLPPRIRGASPGYFVCKGMCDFPDVCFHTVKPDRNCRTCAHWFPMPDGTHHCVSPAVQAEAESAGWDDVIVLDKEAQKRGCDHYTMDPEFK